MKISRAIAEFFCPSKKCKRIGHNYVTYHAKVFSSKEWGYVAEKYDCWIDMCSRCWDRKKPYHYEYIVGYTGVERESSWWDKFRKDGYVVEEIGCKVTDKEKQQYKDEEINNER